MKKLYHIYLPSFSKKTIDLRRWYYVYIDGEKMPWWCLYGETDDISTKHLESELVFIKIPFYKTILR